VSAGNERLAWHRAPTAAGVPLDDLFADNLATVDGWLGDISNPSSAVEGLPA
jgi:hypothetical protein